MRSSVALSCGVALLASAILAAQSAANPGRLRELQAGTYHSDPAHTQGVFSLSHFGFSDYTGIFSAANGTLQLDPLKLEASKLEISIPVRSITTTSPKLTEELKGEQWFNAATFPVARFVSTKISSDGDGSFTVAGNAAISGLPPIFPRSVIKLRSTSPWRSKSSRGKLGIRLAGE